MHGGKPYRPSAEHRAKSPPRTWFDPRFPNESRRSQRTYRPSLLKARRATRSCAPNVTPLTLRAMPLNLRNDPSRRWGERDRTNGSASPDDALERLGRRAADRPAFSPGNRSLNRVRMITVEFNAIAPGDRESAQTSEYGASLRRGRPTHAPPRRSGPSHSRLRSSTGATGGLSASGFSRLLARIGSQWDRESTQSSGCGPALDCGRPAYAPPRRSLSLTDEHRHRQMHRQRRAISSVG